MLVAIVPKIASQWYRCQYRKIYAALDRHSVHYIVIGGTGVQFYVPGRCSFDLDLLIEKSYDNVSRLLEALQECRFALARLCTIEEILANDVTFLSADIRIDIAFRGQGIQFDTVWPRRIAFSVSGISVWVAAPEDILANKQACGRPADDSDILDLQQFVTPV